MGEITVDDVLEYEHLLKFIPSFLLKRMAKKKSNLVKKFQSKVEDYLGKINDGQKEKLDIALATPVEDLQVLMGEAYKKSGKKHFEILSNPDYKEFIEINCDELRNLVAH